MGILTVDSQYMQRKHKRVQFDVLVSRAADEPFISVGQIDGELDNFITIQSLKEEGSQTFANSEGFNNVIRFPVATQSLLDNTSIFNIETLDKGLWYVQFKEVYGTINFVTPFPVSLKITAGIRTGNHKSQSTLIETFFYTTDLDWVKDSRPPTPLLIKPDKLATGNPPHPPSQTIDLSNGITFRLSNPAVKPILQELTLYDIRIYSDAFQQNEVASKLNLTKAQIIDADYVVTSNTQLTGFSNLQRGRKYYVRIIAKYLGLESPPLDFAIAFGFTTPSLSGYPSSIEYPTYQTFQVTAQRNTPNANNDNANQVEFEWRIGTVVQSSVSAAYNNAGEATVTFQLPNITTTDSIFVKARSRNSVVIGEWSDNIQISVTLFRPLPNILIFNASQSKVALNAKPETQVFFTIQFSYSDAFGGNCSWKIERVDTSEVILNGVQAGNPYFQSGISVPLPSVSIPTTLTYRLTVTNPNEQSVTSDISIEYLPRPSISDVFFFFNPNYQTYQDIDGNIPANANQHVVALIKDEINPARRVEQQTVANRPVLIASGNRFFLESSVAGRNLRQPATDNALPTDLSQRNNFTWIMVGNFPDRSGEICQPMNLAGTADIIFGFWFSGKVLFRVGNPHICPDIELPNTPYNTWNIMQVVVVTYQRNTVNGFKVYSSLYPTSLNRLVGQQTTNNNTLGGSNNDRMKICNAINSSTTNPRRAGHIIAFKRTLSQSEVFDWINWLCAYYQITPAP